MAGTNAVAFRRALIDTVAAFPALAGVQVVFSWPGPRFDRECVHLGRSQGSQEYATFGGGRARQPRNEQLDIDLFVVVRLPSADDGYNAELRAAEIGTLIEDGIAATPQIQSVAGMLYAGITGVELESYADNDAWAAIIKYTVTVHSRLN